MDFEDLIIRDQIERSETSATGASCLPTLRETERNGIGDVFLDPWIEPLRALEKRGCAVQRTQWNDIVRALTEAGVQPEELVDRTLEWSHLVEPGQPFPGFPKGREHRIAALLEGIRKVDD